MTDASTRVADLPPEQEAIRAKCFHSSGTFVPFESAEIEQSIPERFEKIVAKYPDRIAVKTGNRVVTYNELNAMANRVARAIPARHGAESEPVGLLLEKDARLIAAMLGVLKAGKFFVLLDPSFPSARIAALLADSQPKLVIVDRRNAALARSASSDLCRSMEFESIDCTDSPDDLRLEVSPEAAASLLYTSGSTGRPKGIIQNHRNMLSKARDYTNLYHVCEQDRFSLLASGTSNSVVNTFIALLQGAALLPFDVQKEGVMRLGGWLLQERISLSWISSPLFRNLTETLTGKKTFSDLRLIRLTSEAAYKTDVALYKKHFSPNCILASGMSSTETGPLTEYFIDHQTEISDSRLPVGYAVEGKEILLLGDTGNEIHPGEIGEIAVRGSSLFSIYWREPELTAAKFKPDPYNSAERLYLTGDLGLRLPGGCLVHKGRKDFRVKIRGYGVELAEVEKALVEHPSVREAVVTTQQNPSGEARLIAYFTSVHAPGPTVSELFRYLKEKLPDYMIPTALVRLDALPLTSNGKIDRSALPAPGKSRPELDTPFTLPRTATEETLAEIWADVLGFDRIGIHDDFFALGGYSLLATRVLSRILDRFQIELSLNRFFETPTVAALAAHIEIAGSPQNELKAGSIKPASRDGSLVLSSAQQRLWFLDQLEPGSFAYNLSSATRITGRLDASALERSFNEIVSRHEALRTVFKAGGGEPFQIILPSLTLELPVVDLQGIVSDTEREQEVRRLCAAETQRPFDLARGPLLRITLLRLGENEYILLQTIHHIVFDGWSGGILAQELAALYKSCSDGSPVSLPVLPIQYAHFAQWQRQRTHEGAYETEIAYWKKKLKNLPMLHLPTDRPRPPVRTTHGAREFFAFSESLSAGLKSLGNRHGVTLFMTLLAGYQTLLHHYTGQPDIVIGSPVSGRNRSETEGLIGFFLNMLVLRTDLSGNPTFRELLARIRKTCVEAYAHQDLPFEKLVEELQPTRDLSRNPLFQVTFAFQNTPRFSLELPDLTTNRLEIDPGITIFDLHLFVAEEEGRLRGCIDYNTDLFDAATIQRLLEHLHILLEGMVANPDRRISDLPLLTNTERHQLLVEWNDTKQDYPKDRCIHELFEEQAARTPDAVAVVFPSTALRTGTSTGRGEDHRLTYRELNWKANQLAHYLKRLGVGPEVLVGICMERSLEMVIGLLGILKAGGACVPLDPEYPRERLAFMLEDVRAPVLLTQQGLISMLPDHSARTVCLDTDWQFISRENADNPVGASTPDNLVYVIYTSGSTGKPKGVAMSHRPLCNLISWRFLSSTPLRGPTTLQFAPLSFDVSFQEIFSTWCSGGTLLLVSEELRRDAPELLRFIKERAVERLFLPFVALQHLAEVAFRQGQVPTSLREIITAGEQLQITQPIAGWLTKLSGCSLHNQYGPSESHVVTAFTLMGSSSGWPTFPPIGRPIANTQIHLLDSHLQSVPVGVLGELYIGGIGLARSYLNRLELTAERFIPNPFSEESGARLYKTGDLARYLPDGNIEFLGRIDNQVKIRGFRIELGEIETVLGNHPAVREAVVLIRDEVENSKSEIQNPKSAGKRLVAYVVPNPDLSPSTNELRSFLKEKLPEYMIPSAFVMLDRLPLTPSGKLDRKALPVPDGTRPELEKIFVAPRTPVEESLAVIWAEVLKLDRVGIHDNFFELGGHSLLATQVASRIRGAFNVDLPLRSLFERPNVAGLAEAITQSLTDTAEPDQTAAILSHIESLSEEEARHILSREGA